MHPVSGRGSNQPLTVPSSGVGSKARLLELESSSGQPPLQTPVPLLLTSRGQLPRLPRELFDRMLGIDCPPPFLQLPLTDWYCLNPNSNVLGADIVAGAPTKGGVASFAALPRNAVTVLSTRAAASSEFITSTPGNALSISTESGSCRPCISPAGVAALHSAMQTSFVESPSDAPFTHAFAPLSKRGVPRSIERAARLLDATLTELDETSASVEEADYRTSVLNNPTVLVPIQGGADVAERERAAIRAVAAYNARPDRVAGFVLAGFYSGESPDDRWRAVDAVVNDLPSKLPRFLAGSLGSPADVLEAVARGIDVVDSAYPFTVAADGCALDLARGVKICLRDRKFERSAEPLLVGCHCLACGVGSETGGNYSRAYIRHLLDVHEMLGETLLVAHNLRNYLEWFQRLRDAIAVGQFENFRHDFYKVREEIRTDCNAQSGVTFDSTIAGVVVVDAK